MKTNVAAKLWRFKCKHSYGFSIFYYYFLGIGKDFPSLTLYFSCLLRTFLKSDKWPQLAFVYIYAKRFKKHKKTKG